MMIQYQGFETPQREINSLIKYHEKRNKQLLATLIEDPQVSQLLQYALYSLNQHNYEKTINLKEDDNYFADVCNEEFVANKLYGLELHKLKEFFVKADDYINEKVFIVITFKILHCTPDESPYILNGVRELFNTILLQKQNNWQNITDLLDQELYQMLPMIRFEDFLTNYMNVTMKEQPQAIKKEPDLFSLLESKQQDRTLHKNDLKKVVFARSIGLMAISEEGLDEIVLLDGAFQIQHHLKLQDGNYQAKNLFILDFAYSESLQEFGATLQDHSLTFWSHLDQYRRVKKITSPKMHLKIYFMELLRSWVTINTSNSLIVWKNKVEKEIKVNIDNSQIQTLFEIQSKKIICLQTDNKKIYLFNYQFTQKLLTISDSFIFQQVAFNVQTQSFYSTCFSNSLQKWTLEKTSTDYTREEKLMVCKQEYSILAFAFISNDSFLITFDSSSVLKIYDPKTFQQLTYLKKLIKPTSNMLFIELQNNKIALLGQRVYVFQFIRKDELVELKPAIQDVARDDIQDVARDENNRELMMQKTKAIIGTLTKTKNNRKLLKKLSMMQEDKAEKLQILLEHKTSILDERNSTPLLTTHRKLTLPEVLQASLQLQELDQKQQIRRLNLVNHKLSPDLQSSLRQQGDPAERIRSMKLNDSLKKMLSNFSKVDEKLTDDLRQTFKQNAMQQQNNISSKEISTLQDIPKSEYNKQLKSPKLITSTHSSRTDYLNYFNYQPNQYSQRIFQSKDDTEKSTTITKSQRNAVKKVILKSLQTNPKHLGDKKRELFSKLILNIPIKDTVIETTQMQSKFKQLQKLVQDIPRIQTKSPDYCSNESFQSSHLPDASKMTTFQIKKKKKKPPQTKTQNQLNLNEVGVETLQNTRKYLEQVKLAMQFIEVENTYRGLSIM